MMSISLCPQILLLEEGYSRQVKQSYIRNVVTATTQPQGRWGQHTCTYCVTPERHNCYRTQNKDREKQQKKFTPNTSHQSLSLHTQGIRQGNTASISPTCLSERNICLF